MPASQRGAIAGLATTTKGIALILGPVAAGVLIDVLGPQLEATDGYQVLWPLCGLPILAALPLVYRLTRVEPRGPGPSHEKIGVPIT